MYLYIIGAAGAGAFGYPRLPHGVTAPFSVTLNVFFRSLSSHQRPQGFPSRPPERAPEKSPQNAAFLHPTCEAKVSSRLDGSTVFTVSPGPLLAPILETFWYPFGSQGVRHGTLTGHSRDIVRDIHGTFT